MNHPEVMEKKNVLNARFHLYAITGSLCFTVILGLVTRGRVLSDVFMLTFVMMMVQVELFAWIGGRVFKTLVYNSVKEFVQRVIPRLLFFYLFVVIIAAVIFVTFTAIWGYSQGAEMGVFLRQLPEKELRGFIIGSSFGLLIGTILFFFMELMAVIKREQKLSEEKMRYHYETLKNQMNPHFLFNSLNTLSSIIYQDVQLADRFIVKLSSIYRYILDQHESKMVNLKDELDFVKDFFYLQQLRDDNRINLEINIEQPSDYQILPVSLQLLVENALKHNAATPEKPLNIRISKSGDHYIVVENNLQPKQQLDGSFRIGLKNLAERVQIITGKELQVQNNKEYFSVKIPISPI